jgi:hypothetical protein
MQIDWRREVNEAAAVKLVCDQCGKECASATYFARHLYCGSCADQLGVAGSTVSYETLLAQLLREMRTRLDEWATHLEKQLERRRRADVDPLQEDLDALQVERYRGLEDQYLSLHRAFRRRGYAIPNPGWRSAYVERVINCGVPSKLGD